MTDVRTPANYEHWRAHGDGWAEEYDRRKKRVPYYHIQEAMLVAYVAARAPLRVLEYGCGPGRHLRNLSRIPGVEVHGFDQSLSMARGCLLWADEEWFSAHVHVGEPTGRLPFDDGDFDLVYTSEVLIHVRPEDLAGRLAELRRVGRREVLHIEPSPGESLDVKAHSGCWNHDLVAEWAALGARCELLPRGFQSQSPYRVILDGSKPPPDWPEALLAVYRRLETDLAPGLERMDVEVERAVASGERAEVAEARADGAEARADEAEARADEAEARLEALRSRLSGLLGGAERNQGAPAPNDGDLARRVAALAAAASEFESYRATGGYRLVEALKSSRAGRPLALAGKVVVPVLRSLALGSRPPVPDPRPAPMPLPSDPGETPVARTPTRAREFSDEERAWLERAAGARSVGVCHPDWRGIRRSAGERHPVLFHLREDLDRDRARHAARLLAEAAPGAVAFEGFPSAFGLVAGAIRAISPRLPIVGVWHGSFMHTGEDVAWNGFLALLEAARAGDIDRVGFVKKGMAEIIGRTGVKSAFVMNTVRAIPAGESAPAEGGPHLGIWGLGESWKKPPYAMIAAASAIPGAELHGAGMPSPARALAALLGVRARLEEAPVQFEEMPRRLASMHLNLYVTLTECAPMLPLESLSVGVPCLFGPTAHYFEDHETLRRALVVPMPDCASTIAGAALRALSDRAGIVEAYRGWAPGYNRRAIELFDGFLRGEPGAS